MPKRLHLPANKPLLPANKTLFDSQTKFTTQINYPLSNHNSQQNTSLTNTIKLHQQSHIFIVILGAIIGGIIALAIGYSVKGSFLHYFALTLIPLSMSLILSKVYIHTLIHFKD